ncbi:PilZ domain-containing protein [Aurantimonas sp. VKM B-3413]|uniref:PilZ domain-containing protein n=1 Tax=Aurantimonas sp. VKM B-3413 TaxID=2779401 RepID=UPI001E4E180F|nr:PilZ domain-containing protein [Aurantimonas sp. VKM B-3413]MCB8840145.1 PilZ domain-containing protein [Aurantimonas sp. VKM B-3413]
MQTTMTAQPPLTDFVERRRFQRVSVDLHGRFMRQDLSEYPCRIENMSPGGVAVLTQVTPQPKERIIFYIDHIGRLEGTVARLFKGGFAVDLVNSERKRERLAARLTWLANRSELDLPEDRRHERIMPTDPFADIVLEDGRRYQVQIIDLSLSGAAVQATVRPALGARVTLGTMQGRVVRHLDEGFAIEFANVQARESLERLFR